MTSVSVYRSYAKYVFGTNTLTFPTHDNGWLSAPPTELFDYHDNRSHGGLIQLVLASQSL